MEAQIHVTHGNIDNIYCQWHEGHCSGEVEQNDTPLS